MRFSGADVLNSW